MRLTFARANEADAPAIAELRSAVAADLTVRFGAGHWSADVGERGVLFGMRDSSIWVARSEGSIVGTFRLATRKPWSIDRSCFTHAERPLYLTDMAVRPDCQRAGIGTQCLAAAVECARDMSADCIRLDAYDSDAGAGTFYEKANFRETRRVSYRGVALVYYEFLLRVAESD